MEWSLNGDTKIELHLNDINLCLDINLHKIFSDSVPNFNASRIFQKLCDLRLAQRSEFVGLECSQFIWLHFQFIVYLRSISILYFECCKCAKQVQRKQGKKEKGKDKKTKAKKNKVLNVSTEVEFIQSQGEEANIECQVSVNGRKFFLFSVLLEQEIFAPCGMLAIYSRLRLIAKIRCPRNLAGWSYTI